MRLSVSFTLDELLHSQEASRRGLDNTPGPEELAELRRLVTLVLQPLRDALMRPVLVSSGYRSPAVNAAVGGAPDSAHMRGQAADVTVPGMAPSDVCNRVLGLSLPVQQVIHEFGRWTHVAVAPLGSTPRREALTATWSRGGTVYTRGIV